MSALPERVTLSAIEYQVVEREGSIIFTEAYPVWGQGTRMHFSRMVEHGSWQLTLHGDSDAVACSHIVAAYRMIVEAYGDGCGSHSV